MKTLSAIFDAEQDAKRAQDRLYHLGIGEADVRVVGRSAGASAQPEEHHGMWESIKEFFMFDQDKHVYSEGVRRGGYLLTARVDDGEIDAATQALQESGPVDLDTRTTEWQAEGWQPHRDATTYGTQGNLAYPTQSDLTLGAQGGAQSAGNQIEDTEDVRTQLGADSGTQGGEAYRTRSDSASSGTLRDGTSEEAIPVINESLKVGKREVNRGTVRVSSRIVEEPVHEEVRLREDRVEVERRPVIGEGRTANAMADGALQNRTIEVSEMAEEAVVAKEARVTEEVVVKKFQGERTQGVDDTVRHTEVQVDDGRTGESKSQTRTSPEQRTEQRTDR
jgi:uncharacterized protein (TIGR02271 family)